MLAEMSELPPEFAQYPRGTAPTGSLPQLRNLVDGYFGLSRVFGINILLVCVERVVAILDKEASAGGSLAFVGGFALIVGLVVGFLSYGPNKQIGNGANWSPAQPIVASVLMGINSALCCGIVGYAVMQTIAANHLKRYGIKMGFFASKKKIESQIAALEAQGLSGPHL